MWCKCFRELKMVLILERNRTIWHYLENITITCFKKTSLKYLQTHLVPKRPVK